MTTFNSQLTRIENKLGTRINLVITICMILMLVFFLMGTAVGWLVGKGGDNMEDFIKEVVLTAMKKMFQGSHFSICDVDRCLKLTGSIPNGQDYDALSALHCINWRDMAPNLRETVFEKTVAMLSCDGFDLSTLEMMFNEKQKVFELKQPKKKRFKLLG